jgi:hypothetical protein
MEQKQHAFSDLRLLRARRMALTLAIATLLALSLQGGARGSKAPVSEASPTVLTLGSASSAPPCETSLDGGSAPDASHAWINHYSTADGGRSWRVIKLSPEAAAAMHLGRILEPVNDSTGLTIKSAFITPRRGWFAVSRQDVETEWETRDGGKTWRSLPDLSWSHMWFADARHGLAFVATREQNHEALITADAGDTWQRCGVVYRYADFDAVSMLDARRGWAWVSAPAPEWTAPSAGGAAEADGPLRHGIMRTSDGGCHWRGVWSAETPITEFGDLYFLDEHHGWLAGGHKSALYATADGGRSWQPLPLPFKKTWVESAYFHDLQAGWLLTDERLFETRDAGRTWREVPRDELLSRLGELLTSWKRWRMGKLYGMLARGGCFTREQLRSQRVPLPAKSRSAAPPFLGLSSTWCG